MLIIIIIMIQTGCVSSLCISEGGMVRLETLIELRALCGGLGTVGSRKLNLEKWAQPLGDLNFHRATFEGSISNGSGN